MSAESEIAIASHRIEPRTQLCGTIDNGTSNPGDSSPVVKSPARFDAEGSDGSWIDCQCIPPSRWWLETLIGLLPSLSLGPIGLWIEWVLLVNK